MPSFRFPWQLLAILPVLAAAVMLFWDPSDEPLNDDGPLIAIPAYSNGRSAPVQESAAPETAMVASETPVELPIPTRAGAQKRDPVWADKTEIDIDKVLGNIPYSARSTPLRISCGATLCEATGTIDAGVSAANRKIAYEYLREKEFAEDLGRANVLTDEVELDRDTGSFTIFFSRVRR